MPLDASSLDLLACSLLFDGYAKQSPGRITATTGKTRHRNPGKDRCSGEGTGSDRWRAGLDNEGCGSPEEEKVQCGGKSQNIIGDEGSVGEEEGKEAPDQARNGKSKRTNSGRAIEGTNRPDAESGRKTRRDGKGSSFQAWKRLRQHQRLVPHHGEEDEGNQEGRTGQICLGGLKPATARW